MSVVLSPNTEAGTITFVREEMPRLGFVHYDLQMSVREDKRVVTMFEGAATRCTCEEHWCEHTAIAERLERDYQEHLRMTPAFCSYCGRMCRTFQGQSTCPLCAGF